MRLNLYSRSNLISRTRICAPSWTRIFTTNEPDDIKTAEAVLLDANILVYAALEKSQQCRRLLHRCAEHEVVGVAGLQQIAELMHRLMMVEAQDHDWLIGGNPAKHLASHPERVRALNRYSDIIKGFLASGFKYETLAKEDFIPAMSLQRQYGLMANDALMIAMAERLRIHAIASADKAFAKVRGFVLYSPDDL